jgi:predicted GIY-YIG superfamily endonuclease
MNGSQEHGGRGGGPGTVYLIHLDTPYKHARHYTGWTTDLDARLEAHRAGRGARLMEVIKTAGISWRLARTWPGGRDRERAIKDRHEAPKLCPECSPQPRPVRAGRSAGQQRPEPQAAAAGQLRGPARDTPATIPGDGRRQVQPPEAGLVDAEIEAG